ncbi:unnamed protein product [Malus baccata var. baccata]
MASESSAAAAAEAESRAPLLVSRQGSSGRESSDLGSPTARSAMLAMLLGRATGRRGPSMLVRETAARELDERRADWGYSKPVVALDMMWNTAFVVVSVVMLFWTKDERPNTPIRLWICGYVLQCIVHVVLVWVEYRRRNNIARRLSRRNQEAQQEEHQVDIEAVDTDDEEAAGELTNFTRSSVSKRCKTVNTMVSFLWWIVGFYWVVSGGEVLLQNAPHLYWYFCNQSIETCSLT